VSAETCGLFHLDERLVLCIFVLFLWPKSWLLVICFRLLARFADELHDLWDNRAETQLWLPYKSMFLAHSMVTLDFSYHTTYTLSRNAW